MKQSIYELWQSTLSRRFASAGLALEISPRPIGTTNRDVFGMDIQHPAKAPRGAEHFRIWRGAGDNRVEVIGTDAHLSQLVLLVHEPPRVFETRVGRHAVRADDPRIVRRDGRFHYVVRERTRDSKRHYLCGFDERHLFIAQLPRGVSTVRDAHHVLKADEIVVAERTRRVTRQGEWFFVEPTWEEQRRLEQQLGQVIVWRRRPIGEGGHPHTADELVRLPPPDTGDGRGLRPGARDGRGRRPEDVFVRGRVRHVDHKTVVFQRWRKVLRNAEPNAGRMAGIAWID